MQKKRLYSNGKLLLTGEYIVLDGAKALAVPTKFGQEMFFEENNSGKLIWESYDFDDLKWFECSIDIKELLDKSFIGSNDIEATLVKILQEAHLMNPQFLANSTGCKIINKLTFPRNWGLGTSSTLVNNLAQLFAIDAYELLKNSFGGSGYDIANAQNDSPILYQIKESGRSVEQVKFDPPFSDQLYFLYLNKKQNSRSGIEMYRSKKKELNHLIKEIDSITNQILLCSSVDEFCNLIENHENLLSQVLESPTVKSSLFPDFDGSIKSLGAWGGDFVLVVSQSNPREYFKNKGYTQLLDYREIIK